MKPLVLLALILIQSNPRVTSTESFHGVLTLPTPLKTTDGKELAKGHYDVEIRPENGQYSILFIKDGSSISVKGKMVDEGEQELPATIPIIGTHFLRSSEDHLRTAQERQFSQTGLPQYAEESRDWKATLRAYRNNLSAVFFIFQVRDNRAKWKRVDFELREQLTPQARR